MAVVREQQPNNPTFLLAGSRAHFDKTIYIIDNQANSPHKDERSSIVIRHEHSTQNLMSLGEIFQSNPSKWLMIGRIHMACQFSRTFKL